jgi:lipoic acid synthetase
VLRRAAELRPDIPTKSGLILGMGERKEEIDAALRDLRAAGVTLLTLGQYLRPSEQHLPVDRWVEPAEFDAWRGRALGLGFREVASGPLVRSSYHAETSAKRSGVR